MENTHKNPFFMNSHFFGKIKKKIETDFWLSPLRPTPRAEHHWRIISNTLCEKHPSASLFEMASNGIQIPSLYIPRVYHKFDKTYIEDVFISIFGTVIDENDIEMSCVNKIDLVERTDRRTGSLSSLCFSTSTMVSKLHHTMWSLWGKSKQVKKWRWPTRTHGSGSFERMTGLVATNATSRALVSSWAQRMNKMSWCVRRHTVKARHNVLPHLHSTQALSRLPPHHPRRKRWPNPNFQTRRMLNKHKSHTHPHKNEKSINNKKEKSHKNPPFFF